MALRTAIFLLGLAVAGSIARADEENLVRNAHFDGLDGRGQPTDYQLSGSAVYGRALLDQRFDTSGSGIALTGSNDGGGVSQTISIDTRQGRSFSFRFRGLPQDDFAAAAAGLFMTVEFSGNGGQTAYDGKRKELYPLVQQARRDLGVNGDGRAGGAAVWRDYVLNFYVPFPQVDRLKLTVGCKGDGPSSGSTVGAANSPTDPNRDPGRPPRRGEAPVLRLNTGGRSFLVADFRLTRLAEPLVATAPNTQPVLHPTATELLPLGGRWFYWKQPGETNAPALFNHANAGRLLYRDGPENGFSTPFAGNMDAVLRAGNEDLDGRTVQADQPVPDNVTVRFAAGSMIVHTHGLPNHPTGRFPESEFGRGNPNAIAEQDETYYLPLEPKENPGHVVTTANNSNHALNMGPIGVAVNGVVFFNPFDAGSMDASNIMDRCCGHPNQDGQYHYHKYPVCLNSPWSDDGTAHSPLLGWAFDGIPIYGPYESANVMAKDVAGTGALNAFNLHYDPQRGWHYHVTPGKFPYLIGGYWGNVERRDVRPPSGRGPMPGGGPPDGPPPW